MINTRTLQLIVVNPPSQRVALLIDFTRAGPAGRASSYYCACQAEMEAVQNIYRVVRRNDAEKDAALIDLNQGIYHYFLSPFKKSEMKIGKATYFLFSIDNLQTKIGKGLKLPFTHFGYNTVK